MVVRLRVSLAIDWRPVQVVLCLLLKVGGDWLQLPPDSDGWMETAQSYLLTGLKENVSFYYLLNG